MAAEDGDADSDAGRAETYLRLSAEAELRRALTFPRYRQPKGLAYPAHRSYFAAMRMMTTPRGSVIFASASGVSSVPGIAAAPAPTRPIRRASAWAVASPLGHSPQRAGAAIARVGQRAAFTAWRLRAQLRGPYRPPRAQECLDRVTRLAGLLVSAGAITEQVGAHVVGDMATALAARSLIDQAELLGYEWPSRRGGRRTAAGGAPMIAIPVGLSTDHQVAGRQVRTYLRTLIVGAASARLTVTARLLPAETGPVLDDEEGVLRLDDCTAVDDQGTGYHGCFSGGGGDERWDGTFDFHRAPSAGVRWLDVSLPGAAPVRIDMSARAPALPTTSVQLPDGAAGRYLDRLTLHELVARRAMDPFSADEQGLVAAASDLLDAGLIAPGSPALGRLAAAADLLNLELPSRLAGRRADKLPDDWLVILARWDSEDGPVGTIPLATQLPDLEGMRCLITGIESDGESASVQVHVGGWPELVPHPTVTADRYHWTARDDGGWLYVAEEIQEGCHADGADITFLLHPAIRPQARTLTITLTGRSRQVGVTVPLDWRVNG